MPDTSTALEIAQRVASSVGFVSPQTLTASDDENARKLLALLNRGCSIMASKRGPFGESWPELTRQQTITTIAGQDLYALPDGFSGFVSDTVWDRSDYRPAFGPTTPQEWQQLKSGLIDTVDYVPYYRIVYDPETRAVRFRIDPVPGDGGMELSYEYLSSFWVRDSVGGALTAGRITRDTQIPIFPAYLVELDLEWRMRKATGQVYVADLGEFEMERDRLFSQSIEPRDVRLAPRYDTFLSLNVQEGNFPGPQ